MSEKLVTVASFPFPLEAHIARTRLESEGIECALLNEQILGVQPFWSLLVGGVKLQVRAGDAELATRILENLDGEENASEES